MRGQGKKLKVLTLEDGDFWRSAAGSSLLEIERNAATLDLDDGAFSGAIEASLNLWFAKHVTNFGVLRERPFSTWEAFSIVADVLKRLPKQRTYPEVDEKSVRLMEGALRTIDSSGWLLGEAEVSTDILKRLSELAERGRLRSWQRVIRSLIADRTTPGTSKTSQNGDVAKRNGRPPAKRQAEALPPAGFQSDAAHAAVLRRDWSAGSAVLAIDHGGSHLSFDFRIRGERVLFGESILTGFEDGNEFASESPWAAACWFQDDDGEYFELRKEFGPGRALERQFYLSRRSELLLTVDTMFAPHAAKLELRASSPAPCVRGMSGEPPTRSKQLAGLTSPIRAVPLGESADPFAPANGRLALESGRLVASASGHGRRLVLPLAWSWSGSATTPQLPWRPLTITNDRRAVPPDEAVAYRLPQGNQQIVFFRRMAPPARYAFCGCQTYHECVIGEVMPDGSLYEWVSIE